MSKVPMTVHGAEQLRQELDNLKKVERPRIIAAIAEARAHGDLSENAEYHAAKEQQSFIEGRIAEVEAKLSSAQVIDPKTVNAEGRVVFGATVDLLDIDSDTEVTYQIVGDDEADIEQGKISISSPIARALISKEEGDEVVVKVPDGERNYEILAVKYL
ncbi:MAG: transcription elongation factor GreA [Acidiferrobacterales bacterium]